MTDEFSDKTTKQNENVDDAIITQLNERLAILEAKSSKVEQRFDLLERTIGDLSTSMHKAISQLDPLYQLALELQNKQQANPQTAAQQTAAPQSANTTQSVTPPPVMPGTCMAGTVPGNDVADDVLAVPARPDIRAISGTANNGGGYGGGCGGGSSSSEIIDFAIDTAKIVGTVAAVGIAGYAAYKGGQWLVEKISEWHK